MKDEQQSIETRASEFLHELFPNVKFAVPQLGCDEVHWKIAYVAIYGLNEVASHYGDEVEVAIAVDKQRLTCSVSSNRQEKRTSLYEHVIDTALDGEIEGIIERTALPTFGNEKVTDHRHNLEALDMILGMDSTLGNGYMDLEETLLFDGLDEALTDYEFAIYEKVLNGRSNSRAGIREPKEIFNHNSVVIGLMS